MRLFLVVLFISAIAKISPPPAKCLPGYVEPTQPENPKPKPGKDDPEPEPEPDPEDPEPGDPTTPTLESCKSQTLPTGGCVCVEDFQPIGCTCPKTANEIILLKKETCDCIPKGDTREECLGVVPLPFNLLKYTFENGVITVDETSEDTLYSKTDLNTISPYDVNLYRGQSFIFIQDYVFQNLSLLQKIGRDVSHCPIIQQYKQNWMFGLMGLSCYAKSKKNVTPSIVHAADHMPSRMQILPGESESQQINQGCNADPSLLIYSFMINGIVASSCIPNFVPDIEGESRLIPNWCIDDTQIIPNLKGFKIGYNKSVSNEVLKQDITRVGPVYGTIQRYNYNEDCERTKVGDPQTAIFIGWETDASRDENWIVAVKKDEVVESGSNSYTETTYELSKIPFITNEANDVEIDITFIYISGNTIQPLNVTTQPDPKPPSSPYPIHGKSGSDTKNIHSIWSMIMITIIPAFILFV